VLDSALSTDLEEFSNATCTLKTGDTQTFVQSAFNYFTGGSDKDAEVIPMDFEFDLFKIEFTPVRILEKGAVGLRVLAESKSKDLTLKFGNATQFLSKYERGLRSEGVAVIDLKRTFTTKISVYKGSANQGTVEIECKGEK
jgi:hypothetical protein